MATEQQTSLPIRDDESRLDAGGRAPTLPMALPLAWPLACLVLVAITAIAGALWIGSAREDESQRTIEQRIVDAQLGESIEALRRVALDFGWWNEAYDNLSGEPDLAWIEANYGAYLASTHQIDHVWIRAANGRLLFAAVHGRKVSEEPMRAFDQGHIALLMRQAAGDSRGGPRPAIAFVRRGAEIHLLIASPVLPEAGSPLRVAAADAPRLMLAQSIDRKLLDRLAQAYDIDAPRVVGRPAPGQAAVPLLGPDGRPVGYLAWEQRLPGANLRGWMLPALVMLGATFCLFAYLTLRHLRLGAAAVMERESAQRELAEHNRTERFKSELIGTVSHELRTPLTAISGSLSLVLSGNAGQLPARATFLVEMAHRNTARLITLVNDILDMERIESGRLVFVLKQVDLGALVREAVATNESYAAVRGIRLVVTRADDGLLALADPQRLSQVLANLISNACKYSDSGQVVEVSAIGDGRQARIMVEDHGSGVPIAFQDRIFQRFAQADSSDMRSKGGTGLGLAISRAIVERHGGHIGFDSRPGETRFFFTVSLLPDADDGPA